MKFIFNPYNKKQKMTVRAYLSPKSGKGPYFPGLKQQTPDGGTTKTMPQLKQVTRVREMMGRGGGRGGPRQKPVGTIPDRMSAGTATPASNVGNTTMKL